MQQEVAYHTRQWNEISITSPSRRRGHSSSRPVPGCSEVDGAFRGPPVYEIASGIAESPGVHRETLPRDRISKPIDPDQLFRGLCRFVLAANLGGNVETSEFDFVVPASTCIAR